MLVEDITHPKIAETDREPPHNARMEKKNMTILITCKLTPRKLQHTTPSWHRQSSQQYKDRAGLGGCYTGLFPKNLSTP